jgi:hypothetical protein
MLKRFGMEDCKLVTTPMQTSCKLRKDDDSKYTDQRQYRSMIGSLLYVTTSRPDVMQAVGQVARFQEPPKESHVLATERGFSDISKEHKILDYGIQKERIYHLLPTQMQIGKFALMIDEAPVEKRSTWVSV